MAEIIPQEFADFTEHDGLCPHATIIKTSRELRGEPERIPLRYVGLIVVFNLVVFSATLAWLGGPIGADFLAIIALGHLGVLAAVWIANHRLKARQGTWFVLDKSINRLHLMAADLKLEPAQVQHVVEYHGWYWGDRNQAERTCEISVLAQIHDETRRLRVVLIDPRRAPRLSKLLASTFHVPRTVVTTPYFHAGPPRQVLIEKSC